MHTFLDRQAVVPSSRGAGGARRPVVEVIGVQVLLGGQAADHEVVQLPVLGARDPDPDRAGRGQPRPGVLRDLRPRRCAPSPAGRRRRCGSGTPHQGRACPPAARWCRQPPTRRCSAAAGRAGSARPRTAATGRCCRSAGRTRRACWTWSRRPRASSRSTPTPAPGPGSPRRRCPRRRLPRGGQPEQHDLVRAAVQHAAADPRRSGLRRSGGAQDDHQPRDDEGQQRHGCGRELSGGATHGRAFRDGGAEGCGRGCDGVRGGAPDHVPRTTCFGDEALATDVDPR